MQLRDGGKASGRRQALTGKEHSTGDDRGGSSIRSREAAGAKAGSFITAESSQSWRQDFRVNYQRQTRLGLQEREEPKDRITHANWAWLGDNMIKRKRRVQEGCLSN